MMYVIIYVLVKTHQVRKHPTVIKKNYEKYSRNARIFLKTYFIKEDIMKNVGKAITTVLKDDDINRGQLQLLQY